MPSRATQQLIRDWLRDSRHWDRYTPRAGDVVIASTPKAGTTWLQRIVSLLIFQDPAPRPLTSLSPWLDCRFHVPIDGMIAAIETQTHRRFLKTHLPFDAFPLYDDVRYILVARDCRDATLSYHNHYTGYLPAMLERMDAVGLGDDTIGRPLPRAPRDPLGFFRSWLAGRREEFGLLGAPEYFDILRTFWSERRRPNVLLVHYNDLSADLAGEMRRIAAFLGIIVAEQVWPLLVEAAKFAQMKRDGAALLPSHRYSFADGSDTFLYRGKNERWCEILTVGDLEQYDAALVASLTPALRRWQELGRRAAGDPVATLD